MVVNNVIFANLEKNYFDMVRFDILWKNHPGNGVFPCDRSKHINQCAIRMSVALEKSGVDLMSFGGVKCWEKHEDGFKHILRAQELANWINIHSEIFGNRLLLERKKYPTMSHKSFRNAKGIIFIKDGWGATDHIDVWNGMELKGGDAYDYLSRGTEIWFWPLI